MSNFCLRREGAAGQKRPDAKSGEGVALDMNEIASPGQLRMSFLRWALFTVPAIVAIGSLMGVLSNSGYDNLWFAALDKPSFMPPGWVFGAAWTVLYVLMGIALAMILAARGAPWRRAAIAAFIVQLLANYAWSPLFFGAHRVGAALGLILFILVAAAVTAWLFARVRRAAAWLMLPYLAWLVFAAALNWEILQRNPGAGTLVPPAASANIHFGQGE